MDSRRGAIEHSNMIGVPTVYSVSMASASQALVNAPHVLLLPMQIHQHLMTNSRVHPASGVREVKGDS